MTTVSFDLWDTLVRWDQPRPSTPWRLERFTELLAARHHKVPKVYLRRAVATVSRHTVRAQREHGRQLTSRQQITYLLTLLGVDAQELAEEMAAVHTTAALHDQVELLPHALEAVRYAHAVADRVVVISNTGATTGAVHRRLLSPLGLLDLVDEVYFSDEHHLAKPHPGLFQAATHTSGDLVHVGNDWVSDVLGGMRAGGRVVWLRHLGRPVPGVPSVTTLADLPPRLTTSTMKETA